LDQGAEAAVEQAKQQDEKDVRASGCLSAYRRLTSVSLVWCMILNTVYQRTPAPVLNWSGA